MRRDAAGRSDRPGPPLVACMLKNGAEGKAIRIGTTNPLCVYIGQAVGLGELKASPSGR